MKEISHSGPLLQLGFDDIMEQANNVELAYLVGQGLADFGKASNVLAKPFWQSKKLIVLAAAFVVNVLEAKFDMGLSQFVTQLNQLSVGYIIGQSIADLGKGKS